MMSSGHIAVEACGFGADGRSSKEPIEPEKKLPLFFRKSGQRVERRNRSRRIRLMNFPRAGFNNQLQTVREGFSRALANHDSLIEPQRCPNMTVF